MNKKSLILFLTAFLTYGCSSLTIQDFTACAIAPGQSGVVCDNYLTDHQVILDEQEWEALEPGYLCISPQDYGNIKIELEQACSELNCSYEEQQALEKFFKKFP